MRSGVGALTSLVSRTAAHFFPLPVSEGQENEEGGDRKVPVYSLSFFSHLTLSLSRTPRRPLCLSREQNLSFFLGDHSTSCNDASTGAAYHG